jgi:hypothetical protein
MTAFYTKVVEEMKDREAKKATITSQQRGTYNYARGMLKDPKVGVESEDDDDD